MEAIYQQMWAEALPKIKAGNIHCDKFMDDPKDTRRGITLLVRPQRAVIQNMENYLNKVTKVASRQYIYPIKDLHLTTLSIFSCSPNFTLQQIKLNEYKSLVKNTLAQFPPFTIKYHGITISVSGIVAKGYDESGTLNEIREALRKAIKQAGLPNSMDKRYKLQAAHCTLLRFKTPLSQPNLFVDFLEKTKNIELGSTQVNGMELVYNDWYMQSKNVRLLATYLL